MFKKIDQNVLLLKDIKVASAEDLEDKAPRSWGESGEDITARKATTLSRTHNLADTQTLRVVADNSHPVIFNCSPLMY